MAGGALLVSFEELGFGTAPSLARLLVEGKSGPGAGSEPAVWLHLFPVEGGSSLREASDPVRELRGRMAEKLAELPGHLHVPFSVKVAVRPGEEVAKQVAEWGTELVLVLAPAGVWGSPPPWLEELMTSPPADLALFLLPPGFPVGLGRRCLTAVPGRPYAELALRLARLLAEESAAVTVLHLLPEGAEDEWWREEPFLELLEELELERRIYRRLSEGVTVEAAIAEEAEGHSLVLVGASGPAEYEPASPDWGWLVERTGLPVAVVRTRMPIGGWLEVHLRPWTPEDTDKWFAEHTFTAREFADVQELLRLKDRLGVTVSLCIPVLNEEETIGRLVGTLRRALAEEAPLLDEIVVVDSGSEDESVRLAREEGARVYLHRDVLPEMGSFTGKGEALWKSLYVLGGDLAVFLDGDLRNPDPALVCGLVGPLLRHPGLRYVKGYYRRPLYIGDRKYETGGGRVTELLARPLLNLFYPELSGFIQPLAGQAAGWRDTLASVPFLTGWGVEVALLIDLEHHYGLGALAQVDLGRVVHRNKPLAALTPMAFSVARAIVGRLEKHGRLPPLPPLHKMLKLVESSPSGPRLDLLEIEEHERPPMETVPAYRRRFADRR